MREVFGYAAMRKNAEKLDEFLKSGAFRFSNVDGITSDFISAISGYDVDFSSFRNKEGGIDMCEAIEEMKRRAREDERRKFEKERAEYREKAEADRITIEKFKMNEEKYRQKSEADRKSIEKLKQENAILLKKLRMFSA